LDITTGNREQSQRIFTLANELPLLAQQLYYTGESEKFAARCLGLRSVLEGEMPVLHAVALWSEEEVGTFLEQLVVDLQRLMGSISLEWLRSNPGRKVFQVLDEIVRLQHGVSAGANPNKQVLVEALLSKLRRELGTGLLGDNIQAHNGKTYV
jgi:DNA polymerase III subunit delta'